MEKRKIILNPISVDPPIRCYRIHAYVINIIGNTYPDFYLYLISHYLSLHNGMERYRREYLDFHLENNYINVRELFRDNSWFDIIKFEDICHSALLITEIKNQILRYLKQGYYVLHRANEGAFPHSNIYRCEQADNNVLTLGYCYENDSFAVLDYEMSGRFGLSWVSCYDYLRSLLTVKQDNRLKLNFIKAKPGLVFSFDNQHAKKLLSCYVKCENAYPDNEKYKNNIFGYEGVERCIKTMESDKINFIRLRVINEHKKIVSKYMTWSVDHGYIDRSDFCDDYRKISNDMNLIFLKALKKQICYGINKVSYQTEFDAIRYLNEQERKLLLNYLLYIS